jgi:hypothetical protein
MSVQRKSQVETSWSREQHETQIKKLEESLKKEIDQKDSAIAHLQLLNSLEVESLLRE